jgi:hypothetical protein
MTVAAPSMEAAEAPDVAVREPSPAFGRVILSLARVEGRRLLRNPLFLVGVALSVVFALTRGNVGARETNSVVEPLWPAGFPIAPLAVFGFLATNLAAMRDRRSGTEELFGATAAPRRARTAALLASAAWAIAAGIALLVPFAAAFAISYGVSLADVVKLAEEPLIVGVLAIAGVAVGRLLPSRLIGPVVAFFALITMGAYAHPIMHHQFLALWVIPDSLPSVGWHVLYLVGIGILAGTLALLRDGVRRSLIVASATGVLAIAAGAVLQLPTSCPGVVPCVFL